LLKIGKKVTLTINLLKSEQFCVEIDMSKKAVYWILTIPHHEFTPYLPNSIAYIRGQLETANSGFLHWQILAICTSQVRLSAITKIFGPYHAEPTRSKAAEDYVWKEDTAVSGTRFELGVRPFKRNNNKDWARILSDAKRGYMDDIPPDVYIRCYGQLKRIAVENAQPIAMERIAYCFYGTTGTGKSRTAWEEAGLDAYPKDPNSKFWDGYRGQEHVVIDEFRGTISVSHLLRWLDRYPVLVEVKGSSVVFNAKKIWITSNIPPEEWYPGLDPLTIDALKRRLIIKQF